MTSEARKAVTFFAAAAGVLFVVGVLMQRLLGAAGGPETQILSELKQTEGDTLKLEIRGAAVPLVSTNHAWARVVVDADLEARRAQAHSTLDFEGVLGKTKVSSVGLETVPFVYEDGAWTPTRGLAPRLTGIVAALEARRQALESGDVGRLRALSVPSETQLAEDPTVQGFLRGTDRSYRSEAWYIRSDRGEVLVTEEFRYIATTPDRPIDEKGSRRLLLKESGGEFLFSAGLM